ncbi:MAG: hypothetical protein ACI4QN_06635, partial [Candidatus Coproplasma sp.]
TIMDITDVFGMSITNTRASEQKRMEQLRRERKLTETATENKENIAEIAVSDTQPDTAYKASETPVQDGEKEL